MSTMTQAHPGRSARTGAPAPAPKRGAPDETGAHVPHHTHVGRPLAAKVATFVAIILVILMAWFGRHAYVGAERTLEREIDAFGVSVAKAIAAPGTEAWEADLDTVARAAKLLGEKGSPYSGVLAMSYGVRLEPRDDSANLLMGGGETVDTEIPPEVREQARELRKAHEEQVRRNNERLRGLLRHEGGGTQAPGEILDAFVVSKSGALVRALPAAKAFKPTTPSRPHTVEADGRRIETEAVIQEGLLQEVGLARSYRYPVRNAEGEVTHQAYVFLSKARINGHLDSLRNRIFVAMGLVVLIGGAATWLLTRRITAPLMNLVEDVDIVTAGDFKHRASVHTDDEIGLLSRTMDAMIRRLDNARTEHDAEIAGQVHKQMAPEAMPLLRGFDADVIHKTTGEIGGAFYDFVDLEGGRTGVVVAQSSETGIEAAMHTIMIGTLVRLEAHKSSDPAEILTKVNEDARENVREGAHVSVALAALDPSGERMKLAVAGSPGVVSVLHLPAEGGEPRLVGSADTPAIGLADTKAFRESLAVETLDLAKGDRVVWVNEGAAKIVNDRKQELGDEGFATLVAQCGPVSTAAFVEELRGGLNRFLGRAKIQHDVVIVTVEAGTSMI